MISVKAIGGVFLIMMLLGCQKSPAPSISTDPQNVATTSTGEIYFLKSKELAKQMDLARNGDIQAALRVADHYSLGENDTRKSLVWLTMAAEKGNIRAMQNLASSLSALGGKENCSAALDWFQKAKRHGSKSEVVEFDIDGSIAKLKTEFDECISR